MSGEGGSFYIIEDLLQLTSDELAAGAYHIASHATSKDEALLMASYLGVERRHFELALAQLRAARCHG